MRAVASVKSASQYKRVMIYQTPDGVLIFLYKSIKDSACDSDLWFENLDQAYEYCKGHFGVRGNAWHIIKDPVPNYRDDFMHPVPINPEDCHKALIQATDGELNWVKALLSAGANPNGMPLIMAIQCNEPKIVQTLIASGADVNLQYSQTTPLIRAISSTHSEIVEMLIKAGADVNKKGANGHTPLHTAYKYKRKNASDEEQTLIIQMLISSGASL